MQWHGELICGCGRRCLTQLLEVSSLLQSLVCAPMLGFCSRQFLASGNPTKQSYSQATHLVFFKENRTKHLYKVFFFIFLFHGFCCFVSDWCSPVHTSFLPAAAFLSSAGCCSTPREEKSGLREYGEPDPTAHDARGEDHG